MAPDATWHVYILRCGDGTLYTGVTNRLAHRLAQHDAGLGSRYTRARLPVELVHSEVVENRGTALRREAAIKRLPRERKLELLTPQPFRPAVPAFSSTIPPRARHPRPRD